MAMKRRVTALLALTIAAPLFAAAPSQDGEPVSGGGHPGCAGIDAKSCVELAIAAMGGHQRLADIHSVSYDTIEHTALAEQSPRQYPFITSYERDEVTIDFDKQRLVRQEHITWPEADPHMENVDVTLTATPQGTACHSKQGDMPCSLMGLDAVDDMLTLAPERLLLKAAAAGDLHYDSPQWLRTTPHSVVSFTWQGSPVRVLLNADTHLPDAVERTRGFRDFWLAWGDVEQRIYFDNWHLVQGVVFPATYVEQRNGIWLGSTQLLNPIFNVSIDDKTFSISPAAAKADAASQAWNQPFSDAQHVQLAPGVDLYQGAWNTTLIKQDDGVLVLEAPITPDFVRGAFSKAHSEYPGIPIKGVLSTSDSWPHVAGVREAVADGLPVYALDLNQPLLDRLMAAPHRLQPDDLQKHPKPAHWVRVDGRLELGHGANRVVLYPLRGATTERQYMVYFPQYKLLYASDTLAVSPDKTLYDPDMMYEVAQAVAREHLQVDTVFAMHEGPTPWTLIEQQLAKAMPAAGHKPAS
jgi:hypothetical protein